MPAAEQSSMETCSIPQQAPTLPSSARGSSSVLVGAGTQPMLHVEVCQRPHSAMAGTKLKELVVELLMERGTAFSELHIYEFENPILKEHVLSVSITDTPSHLKV